MGILPMMRRVLVAKTLTLLIIALVIGCLGHVQLRIGMKAVGEINEFVFSSPGTWLPFFFHVITNMHVVLGVFLQAIFFASWLILLSKSELSLLLPLTALEYVIGAVLSHYVLEENISWLRLSGTFVVCLGVALICADEFQKNGG